MPEIRVEALSHVYSQGTPFEKVAIEGIDIDIPQGQLLAVIGHTGSGKSTLVNLIPAFYPACDGKVLVDGVDVREYDRNSLRQRIGIVPQKAVLFKGSIRDNLRWGNENATDEEVEVAYNNLREKYSKERFLEGEEGNIAAKKLTEVENAYRESLSFKEQNGGKTAVLHVYFIKSFVKSIMGINQNIW